MIAPLRNLLPYSGNFEEENFGKYRGLKAICESFLCEIWRHAAPTYDVSSNP